MGPEGDRPKCKLLEERLTLLTIA